MFARVRLDLWVEFYYWAAEVLMQYNHGKHVLLQYLDHYPGFHSRTWTSLTSSSMGLLMEY